MWKATLLGDSPSVARVERAHPALCAAIDRILYDKHDCTSCFWDEVRVEQTPVPTLESMLATADAVYIVGARGRPLACVAIEPVDLFGWQYFRALCVDPSQRGRGLGSLLVRHAQRHHPHLELMVHRASKRKDREDARRLVRFYGKHGFKVHNVERAYVTMRWSSAQ